MKNKNPLIALLATGIVLVGVIIFYLRSNTLSVRSEPVPTVTGTPTSVWNALLESTPFAYFTPLPAPNASPLDGVYTKVDSSWPQWWKCLRCADYRVAGGIWKLQFEQGVMRIYYEVTGWRSISSYTVNGNRLQLFNDPYCPEHTGEYEWRIENGNLSLKAINDPCSFELRAKNLSKQVWVSCNSGDDVVGCDDKRDYRADLIPDNLSVTVKVYGGDSRFFNKKPDVYAYANADDVAPPQGIEVTFGENTIAQGLQRILWWEEDATWVQAVVNGEFESIGVQILGEQTIGWARLLFDGEEVWRGNTAGIWSRYGRHGGFIEVSGFETGVHTIRVETLGFDYRPVTVVSFGFIRSGNVEP